MKSQAICVRNNFQPVINLIYRRYTGMINTQFGYLNVIFSNLIG